MQVMGIKPESSTRAVSAQMHLYLFRFLETVSLCSSGCPRTHSVDQTSPKLSDLPVSASRVLRLKGCTTTSWLRYTFKPASKLKIWTKFYLIYNFWPFFKNLQIGSHVAPAGYKLALKSELLKLHLWGGSPSVLLCHFVLFFWDRVSHCAGS